MMIHNNRVPMIDGMRIDEAHKGGGLGSITKSISRAVGQVSKQAKRSAGDVTSADWWTKTGTALTSVATDPGSWLAFAVNPTYGMGMAAQSAADTYGAMSQAERDEADAEAARAKAAEEERVLVEKQKATEAEQAQMVRERDEKAMAESKERAQRLGTGRRGLLYQGASGKEAGVSKVLGG